MATPVSKTAQTLQSRPAETAGAGLSTLLAAALVASGIASPWVAVIIAALGYVPAAVTALMSVPRVRQLLGYDTATAVAAAKKTTKAKPKAKAKKAAAAAATAAADPYADIQNLRDAERDQANGS